MIEIFPKPKKWPKYPRNLKNDQSTHAYRIRIHMHTLVCLIMLSSMLCLVSLSSLPWISFFTMTTSMLPYLYVYIAFYICLTYRLHLGLDANAHFWASRINLHYVQMKQHYMKASYDWTGFWCLISSHPIP